MKIFKGNLEKIILTFILLTLVFSLGIMVFMFLNKNNDKINLYNIRNKQAINSVISYYLLKV